MASRRRHTTYIGDWSSDGCSSDLRRKTPLIVTPERSGMRPRKPQLQRRLQKSPPRKRTIEAAPALRQPDGRGKCRARTRSEERRVGKERTSGWIAPTLNTKAH